MDIEQIRSEYFNQIYTMPQFVDAIHKIPNNFLAILCLESAETHRICEAPRYSLMRSIVDHATKREQEYTAFPVNIYDMCAEVEHEFTLRFFNTDGYIKWN